MTFVPDYHIHTRLSGDGRHSHGEMARAAINKGLTHICFTDHVDLGHPLEKLNRAPSASDISEAVEAARREFPHLDIRSGLEVGWLESTQEESARIVGSMELDFVLLSVHVVGGADCYDESFADGKTKREAYESYLAEVLRCVSSAYENYDCVGHIGYPAKCGHYRNNDMRYADYSGPYDDILREIIRRGKGIEINTSSVARSKHCMPPLRAVRRFCDLGGEVITLGSDAHLAERVGGGIKTLLQALKRNGIRRICSFEGRRPVFHDI